MKRAVSLLALLGGLACASPSEGAEDYAIADLRQDNETTLLARMLFGEARNCTKDEQIAIAYTALNRASDNKKWNGRTVKEALLVPFQYSCFNPKDVNLVKLKNPLRYDSRSFAHCLILAEEVLARKYPDPTHGATHYHTRAIQPSWSTNGAMKKLGTVGEKPRHVFYKER